ncbi:MAG: hypothetical protein PVI80_20220 [Anaerolineae bacterium]|jgi:hypothetical protein
MNGYKVIVIGMSGSGKTFFLASMHKKLSVQTNRVRFFLEAEPNQRRKLLHLYAKIVNPNYDWPPGTSPAVDPQWDFACSIRTEDGDLYRVFNVIYYDYSGTLFTNPPDSGDPEAFEIEREAQQGDALLVLLDGKKVLDMLDGREQGYLELDFDLSILLPIVQSARAMPVHFVLTKWDILEDRYSFEEVRDSLFHFDQFRGIVNQRKRSGILTRLIPVSALGSGFARLDADGQMVKVPDGVPDPFQVEMPLACAVIDKFKVQRDLLHKKVPSALLRQLFLDLLRLARRVSSWVGRTSLPIIGLSFAALEIGLDCAASSLQATQERSYGRVCSRDTAIDSVLSSCDFLMVELEERFYASVL